MSAHLDRAPQRFNRALPDAAATRAASLRNSRARAAGSRRSDQIARHGQRIGAGAVRCPRRARA